MNNQPIGVFDSGLGGLSVVKKLEKLLPGEDIIYFGDTGRVPYGTKSPETIQKYARQDVRFLLGYGVKAIIIACGTVSTVAFDECVREAGVPVTGVLSSAVKAAVEATTNKKIGVIGTSATINTGLYEKNLKELLPGVQVFSRACPLFVPLVENGHFQRGDRMALLAVHEYLDEYKGLGVDTLILGCTHYPLLAGVISEVLPGVKLIDSGYETARDAALRFRDTGMLSGHSTGSVRYFVSDSTAGFESYAAIFLEHTVNGRVERIAIDNY